MKPKHFNMFFTISFPALIFRATVLSYCLRFQLILEFMGLLAFKLILIGSTAALIIDMLC